MNVKTAKKPEEHIYFYCDCGAEIDDPNENVYWFGRYMCEECARRSIGYLPRGNGEDWTFEEVVNHIGFTAKKAMEL